MLTDPAIHSVESLGRGYGELDLGSVGIEAFFATHKCEKVCRHLPRPAKARYTTVDCEEIIRQKKRSAYVVMDMHTVRQSESCPERFPRALSSQGVLLKIIIPRPPIPNYSSSIYPIPAAIAPVCASAKILLPRSLRPGRHLFFFLNFSPVIVNITDANHLPLKRNVVPCTVLYYERPFSNENSVTITDDKVWRP